MNRTARSFRWGNDNVITIGGRHELSKKLGRLKSKDARAVMRAAVMAGVRRGAKRLKPKVPVGQNKSLRKAVGSSFKKNRKDKAGIPVAKWGVNVGKKRNQMARHGFAVMAGTQPRHQKSTQRNTGRIVGKKITQQTALASRAEILALMRAKIEIGIRRVLAGQPANDGGEFERGQDARERRQAKRAKWRQKKIDKFKKSASRSAKRLSKRVQKSAKKTRRRITKATKKLSRNVTRSVKRTRKKLAKTTKSVKKSLSKKLFGKPKRKKRK